MKETKLGNMLATKIAQAATGQSTMGALGIDGAVHDMGKLLFWNTATYRNMQSSESLQDKLGQADMSMARCRMGAFNGAADVLYTFAQKPQLMGVWEQKSELLLRSLTRSVDLYPKNSSEYYDALAAQLKVEQVFDAVVRLKTLEQERMLHADDYTNEALAVKRMSSKECKIVTMHNQQMLRKQMHMLVEADKFVDKFAAALQTGLETHHYKLNGVGLLKLPTEFFFFDKELIILDLSDNQLTSIPEEVTLLQQMRKLYLDNNLIESGLPLAMGQMEKLNMIGLHSNPLRDDLFQAYVMGTQAILAMFQQQQHQAERQAHSKAKLAMAASEKASSFVGLLPRIKSEPSLPELHKNKGPKGGSPKSKVGQPQGLQGSASTSQLPKIQATTTVQTSVSTITQQYALNRKATIARQSLPNYSIQKLIDPDDDDD